MKTWWGLEEELMTVTLCNSEKVLNKEIKSAIQNSEENSDIKKQSRPLETRVLKRVTNTAVFDGTLGRCWKGRGAGDVTALTVDIGSS